MLLTEKRIREIITEEIMRFPARCEVHNISIEGVSANVEIADTPFLRKLGLMNRRSIPESSGMLFVFPNDSILGFWMKNTSIPLSIAYISSNGIIVDIDDLDPYDENSKMSSERVSYALEMNRGWFDKNNLFTGCSVSGLPTLSKS